ncbi:MAG TPA: tetratricopeptide repeat protein [Terriglobales bacterium]|nr:tetratricopeptide repeat protein [Terriglobales bacterium]
MRASHICLLLLFMSGLGNAQSSSAESTFGIKDAKAGLAQQASPDTTSGNQDPIAAAHTKLDHGDSQAAIAMLEKLASGSGPTKGVQHELGIAYYRTGKLQLAEQAFAKAMKEDPNDMESVQLRGLALYRMGRATEAIPFLERVRQWMPNANADANHVLGLCYVNAQRFDDARQAFAAEFGLAANSGAAYLLLGKLLMPLSFKDAAAEAGKKASELAPGLPMAHFLVGEYYLAKSDTDQALREFEKEREINPGDAGVYDRLGDVYARMGQWQQAQEALTKAISLDQTKTGAFILMGKVLLRKDDPQTSLLYLQHAEKMDPGNYLTHTLLGQAYRSLGRNEEAKKEVDMASKILAAGEHKPEGPQ